MKTFECACHNNLFFDSRRCVNCDHPVGICPICDCVVSLQPSQDDQWQCGNSTCGGLLKRCANNRTYDVCNYYVCSSEEEQDFCICCRLNAMIPDLSVADNLAKWGKLEAAKRRVLFVIKSLGFPLPWTHAPLQPRLSFAFQADSAARIPTGHLNGRITINLKEADEVERERARVSFAEPQRTLVGHFRHELGHYYWDALVNPQRLTAFRERFGDERNPAYKDAQQRYYAEGPMSGWQAQFISSYASMHPWEDFAETFGAYVDMATVLTTADHFGLTTTPIDTFDHKIGEYQRVGVIANELSRDMGLVDLVPEVLTPPVIEKLRFIDDLRQSTP